MLLMRTAARIELLQERAGAFRISLGTTNKRSRGIRAAPSITSDGGGRQTALKRIFIRFRGLVW
jgi:hypothetical protein